MFKQLLNLDQSWLVALNNFGSSSKFTRLIFKISGEYLIYIFPIILIVLWFWQQSAKKVALRAALAGIIAWLLISRIIGILVARPRPFESGQIKELFFHRPTYSFPSDHAAFLFAVSLSFWLSGYKKLSIFSFILAIIISFARIAAGIHYPLDIIVGAVLGIIVAWLVWIFDRPLNYFYNFIIALARKVRLA